jgi:hypothetical protein
MLYARLPTSENDLIIAMPDNPLAAMIDRYQNRSISHKKWSAPDDACRLD